jgi:hypothetical protein
VFGEPPDIVNSIDRSSLRPLPLSRYLRDLANMANRGYDVVVDVDTEVSSLSMTTHEERLIRRKLQGDLGHTDLQDDDLEFHSSSEFQLPVIPAALSKHDDQTSTRGLRTGRSQQTRHRFYPTAAPIPRICLMTPRPFPRSACYGPYPSMRNSSMSTLPPCSTDAALL